MTVNEQLRDAWSEIDQASGRDDAKRARHVAAALALLEPLARTAPSAAVFYATGYAWYQHPELSTSRQVRAQSVEALQRAVELDPADAYAHLYLGHNAYDVGDYETAEREFVAAGGGGLDDFYELKREEALVCARIRREGIAAHLDALVAYLEVLAKRPFEDVHPFNTAKTLDDCRDNILRLPPAALARLRVALERFDREADVNGWLSERLLPR